MKIWFQHGSEHSANLVIIGHFEDATEATRVKEIIDALTKQVAEDQDKGTVARVLSEHLGRVGIARDRQRDFMTTAATYSHQLNILLPLVLHERGAPRMPDHIRGLLNRLRDLRNDVGHRGTSRTTLTREVVGECLAAAVFGFHYVRLADESLARREATR